MRYLRGAPRGICPVGVDRSDGLRVDRSAAGEACSMLISEIFYSIQGEGGLAGVPSVFVRTSGCKLRCAWCDTPYASWNPEGEPRTVEEIVAAVQSHAAARHVVLTGGEP